MPLEMQILTQVLGIVAMALGVMSFQAKSGGRILVWQLAANCFWCTHYFLLNAYTGAVLNILAFARNTLYYFIGKKNADKLNHVAVGFCVLSIAVSLVTYQNWLSLLPMFGTAVQTFSFAVKSANKMRLFTLLASPFWLTYNVMAGSITGAVTETFAICSIIVGMIRYRNKEESVDSKKE